MLLTVKIPVAAVEDDVRLVRRELAAHGTVPYIPLLFLKLGLEALRVLRADDALGLNPAAALDAALLSGTIAARRGSPVAGCGDVREAVCEVVRRCAANQCDAGARAAGAFPDVHVFMRRNLPGIDIAGIAQQFGRWYGGNDCTGSGIRRWIISGQASDGLCVLTGWIARHETMRRYLLHDVTAAYCAAWSGLCDQRGHAPEIES